MSKVDRLITEFEEVAARPWSPALAGPQRVWMLVYDEADERRVRARREVFVHAAQSAGHGIAWCDVTDAFAEWMGALDCDYRDAYFASPDLLSENGPLEVFKEAVAERIRAVLRDADEATIVAVTGVGSLLGLLRVSQVIKAVEDDIRGRLAVFFPGVRSGNTYRLLDARDGWTYLALPIPG